MTLLAIIFGASALGYYGSVALRIPRIPILIIIGFVLGTLIPSEQQLELRDHLDLSLTFLLFGAGIELNPKKFKSHTGSVYWVGLVQFFTIFIAGVLMALALDFSMEVSIFLGFGLSASSTLAVLQFLRQRHQIIEPFGRLVVGVLLLQDVVFMTGMAAISRWPAPAWELLLGAVYFLLLGGLAMVCQRTLFPWFVNKFANDVEFLALGSIAICFSFVGLANLLELPLELGAFLAGFSLAKFPTSGVLRGVLSSFFGFFSGIFFFTLGASIQITDWSVLWAGFALSGVVWVFTPLSVFVVSRVRRRSWRGALSAGFYLAQTSELSLVLGLTCVRADLVDESFFNILTLVTIITTLATPILTSQRWIDFLLHSFSRFDRINHPETAKVTMTGHAVILGFGDGGPHLIRPIKESGYPILVVEDDGRVVDQLRKLKLNCLFGDAGDPHILKLANLDQAAFALVSMRRFDDIKPVLRYAKKVKIFVRVFEDSDAKKVSDLGGIPVSSTHAAAIALEKWLENSSITK